MNLGFKTPAIMGILNITPDSFSDGGKYFHKPSVAIKNALKMNKIGADIIDIGAESTRPGALPIKAEIEIKRLKPIILGLKNKNITISIDTRNSQTMKFALENGVKIINDVSSLNYDTESINVIKKSKCFLVLMHMQGNPLTMQKNPKYKNVLLDIYDFFEKSTNEKFKDKKVILDPGIGFGKTLKHNLTLISKISLFHSLGFPILIGTSRKRFINQISGEYDSEDRIGGTLASVIFLLSQGVQIFRVHNVREIKQGIMVYKKINEK